MDVLKRKYLYEWSVYKVIHQSNNSIAREYKKYACTNFPHIINCHLNVNNSVIHQSNDI